MNSDNHVDLFWKLLDAELREQRLQLPRTYADIRAQQGARGALMSGMTSLRLRDTTRLELVNRASLAWRVLQQVFSDVGLALDEQGDQMLRSTMNLSIERTKAELVNELKKAIPKQLLRSNEEQLLDEESAAQMSRYDATISLFMERLRRQSSTSSPALGTVFNFHAQVGAVMSGSNTVTNITQTASGGENEALVNALNEVKTALELGTDALADSRDEVLAVIDETTLELAKSKPNVLRVKQLATGVATAIQAVGSLSPAYATLKVALLHIGITIP